MTVIRALERRRCRRMRIVLMKDVAGCCSAAAHQAPDSRHQLVGLLGACTGGLCSDHAVVRMVVHQTERDLVDRGLDRGDLRQDVDAVPIVLNHLFDAADLPFNPAQTREQLVLCGAVAALRCRCLCHVEQVYAYPLLVCYGRAMAAVIDVLWHGLRDAFLMAWEVWWALVFGFAISAVVQAWVPRERIEHALSGSGPRPVAWATGLGAASSSCSYAAIAIAKSLFQKGASASSALAFQFASTNLVWELGLVLWVLLGWQFTLAEYVGGLVMIVLMAVMLRLFVSPQLEEQARAHAQEADTGHQHNMQTQARGY